MLAIPIRSMRNDSRSPSGSCARVCSSSSRYFYGFFKNKRIVIYDTLIEQVDVPGITAILGHELGHWKLNHTLKNLVLSQVYLGVFLFIFSQFVHNNDLYTSFGFTSQPVWLTLSTSIDDALHRLIVASLVYSCSIWSA